MKKILLLGNCHYTIARFRKELICKLVELGHEVWISFPNYSHGEKESGEETAKRLNCNFIEFEMARRNANVWNEVQTLHNCYKIIKQVSPDIIFTFTIKPNIYGGLIARSRGIPYVVTITGLGSGFNGNGFLPNLLVKLMNISMNGAKKTFFQNSSNLDFFKGHGYSKDNFELIPGSGVNLDEYRPSTYRTQGFYFLYLARVMKEKGIDEFLELAHHYQEAKNIEFHVCGDMEEDYHEIIDQNVKNEFIVYHGIVENVTEYLMKASAIIHPSYYNEGISNTLLEAAASAKPIITTNQPGCKDVVEDGVNGFLFEVRNAKDLIKKVALFMNLPLEERRSMGAAGRKIVENRFDRNEVVEKYIKSI